MNVISRQSRLHFVHCLKPQSIIKMNGSISNSNDFSLSSKHNEAARSNIYGNTDVLDISYIRQQIRPIFFIDSVRVNSRGIYFQYLKNYFFLGYPERMAFRDFRRRFQCLIENENQPNSIKSYSLDEALDDRTLVQKILERTEIYEHRYRLGKNFFFRLKN